MLAKEIPEPFDNEEWLFETKWDGYRAMAQIINGSVRLYSRYNNQFNATFPGIVKELAKIKSDLLLDGEIVLLNEKGFPDFQKLQNFTNNQEYPVVYYVFDILSKNSVSLLETPLIKRKGMLKKTLVKSNIVIYNDHIIGKGKLFYKSIAKLNMEGIIAKRMEGFYYPGKRKPEWLKIKTHARGDAVICGFTSPGGTRNLFGSLLLGLNEHGTLKYCGNVGTGFSENELKEIHGLLVPLIVSKSPFTEKVSTRMPITWVRPYYICVIKYAEITSDKRFRQPVFISIKEEKYGSRRKKK